tara:strand:+ start:3986 stop:5047 length:1062 start_codon:yes stop_codon:yes gene_type:complete
MSTTNAATFPMITHPVSTNAASDASCYNVQSNKFTSFNSLMYDPCNSKQRYTENKKQSEYQLGGAICNSDVCEEGNCDDSNTLVKEYDIHNQLNSGTEDTFFYQDTRGYSTHGQTPRFFNDNNKLVYEDNALKRSCMTNLNYINQYKARNILATEDNYDNLANDANKETGASTSFGNPIPNMVHYRPDDNYLNNNSTNSASTNKQKELHNPSLNVKSKQTQYNSRIGLLDFTNNCFEPYNAENNSFLNGLNIEYNDKSKLCAFGIYSEHNMFGGDGYKANEPSYNDAVLRIPVDSNSIYHDMSYIKCSDGDKRSSVQTSRQAISDKLDAKLAPYSSEQLNVLMSKSCKLNVCK